MSEHEYTTEDRDTVRALRAFLNAAKFIGLGALFILGLVLWLFDGHPIGG